MLAHLFSYDISWGATKKEVERSNFFKEVPKIMKRCVRLPVPVPILLLHVQAVLIKGRGAQVLVPASRDHFPHLRHDHPVDVPRAARVARRQLGLGRDLSAGVRLPVHCMGFLLTFVSDMQNRLWLPHPVPRAYDLAVLCAGFSEADTFLLFCADRLEPVADDFLVLKSRTIPSASHVVHANEQRILDFNDLNFRLPCVFSTIGFALISLLFGPSTDNLYTIPCPRPVSCWHLFYDFGFHCCVDELFVTGSYKPLCACVSIE